MVDVNLQIDSDDHYLRPSLIPSDCTWLHAGTMHLALLVYGQTRTPQRVGDAAEAERGLRIVGLPWMSLR